tara:strand:+ start:432 stop:851 length:420 start_codon:yes stop_codon:yes gene_type:complete
LSNLIKTRKARTILKKGSDEDKKKVLQELEAVAGSEITDVLSWNELGHVTMNSSKDLSHRARKSIKKIKATPNKYGTALEVEMHDKLSALRLLSKHHGILEPQENNNRPAIIGINLKGPEVTKITMDEINEKQEDKDES